MLTTERIAVGALSALMWNVVKRVFTDNSTRLRLAEFIKKFHTPADMSAMVHQESHADIINGLAEAIRMWNIDTLAGTLIDGWIDTLRQMDFTVELSLNPESDIGKCDERIKYAQDSLQFIGSNASDQNCNAWVVDKIRLYIVDLLQQRSIITVRQELNSKQASEQASERASEITSELTAIRSKWLGQLEEIRRSGCDALFTPSATLLTRLEVRLFDYNIVNGEHDDWDVEAMDTITNLWVILCCRANDTAAPRAAIKKMHEINPFEPFRPV